MVMWSAVASSGIVTVGVLCHLFLPAAAQVDLQVRACKRAARHFRVRRPQQTVAT
jgi:hypothetical protein